MKEQQPRWKRGVNILNGNLGEMLGKLYVERHFKPEAKARMEALVANLREAYRAGIDKLEWMGPETKKQAQEKLARFTPKIGYPNKWRDYSKLEIKKDDLVGNIMRAFEHENNYQLGKVGKPIDPEQWGMTPQTINAYYNPVRNEIVFPAAILQPPFFNLEADDAVNYGGIGAVIGHEMGHGFDDQGRSYDATGALRDWWTKTDAAEYEKRAKVLVEQFNEFEPLPGLHVNGAADTRREHRRSDRPRDFAPGIPALAQGQASAGHRRPHGRSALLHGVGAVVEGEGARRGAAPAGADERAFAGDVSRQRTDSEHSRVLRGVWREGGRQAVSRSRTAGKDLVGEVRSSSR